MGVGGVVTITTLETNGGPIALKGITVGTIAVDIDPSTVRLEGCTVSGTVSCLALTAISSTFGNTVGCAALTANNSTFSGTVNATGSLQLRDVTVLAALNSTGGGTTHRLDNCRIGTSYTANGTGATTVARDSTTGFGFNATIADISGCTIGDVLTTTSTATVRFSTIVGNCTVGGAATFYQARLQNVTTITGALNTDFASISGVLPVLTYGSIVVQDTAPRLTLTVPVPLIAAGAVAYVNLSLVGTKLAGMVKADSMVVANPTADLVAAGAGGGLLNVRFSAANTVRFCFLGPLAAQPAATFVIGFV
jgi:hypothetical protein